MSKNLEETERLSFDREQRVELSDTTLELIVDPEPLITGWERVYTHPSIREETSGADKFRFATGNKAKQKWHEEEATPAANVVYTVGEEYHARQEDVGVFGVYGGSQGDHIIVVWHGYDKRIRKR